jgi:putative peptidoglycan lipid II flippase
MLALVMGLGSQVATAYLFGAGAEMDAFFTASIIPVYLQLVLLGGLPFVVIPAFVEEETRQRSEDAWALAGMFFKLIVGSLVGLSIIASLAAPWIIALIAPGFSPAKASLAASMLAIMIFSVPFFGMAYLTSGIENVHNRWFWPAAASGLGSLVNILLLFLLYQSQGALALAWGSLAAMIVQASVTTIPFLRHGWRNTVGLRDPRLIEMGRLFAPFIIFGLFTCSKLILERFYASGLPDGQLSYIGYANKIANIFIVLLASSIASAIFPSMARAFSQDGLAGLVQKTDYGLNLTLALALPVIVIVSSLAVPLVTVLFERGAFLHTTTLSVSILIPIVMVNEIFVRMVNNLLGRTFFILKDTVTANLVQSLTIILYIVAAARLTARWGYFGLSLAQLVQSIPALLILAILLYRRIRPYRLPSFARTFTLVGLISLAAGLVSWAMLQLCGACPELVQLVAGLACAGLIYLLLLYRADQALARSVLEMAGFYHLAALARLRKIKR